jgi:hypothetical protein
MQFFDVLTFLVRTPDIFTNRVVCGSNGLIVGDNLSLLLIYLVLSRSRYIQKYVNVRRTLLVMRLSHMMLNIKLGTTISLSNCLT